MQFLYYAIFSAVIIVADQITKYLTVANIELYADVPFIPGLLQLTYVRNTGAAFSSFEGQQWLFALVFWSSPPLFCMSTSKSPCPSPNWSAGALPPFMPVALAT